MASPLSSSVSSLQASLQLLNSSIDILDTGVNDFPRLCKVLQATRHFELLPEPTLRDAQKAILDEITPSIVHLLSIASNHIDKLARREEALKAKCELQEGRLSHGHPRRALAAPDSSKGRAVLDLNANRGGFSGVRGVPATSGSARSAELRKLTQKKERLQYAVERLELQCKQRERELRKSMAAQ